MRTLRALSVIGLLALTAYAVASFTTMASDGSSQRIQPASTRLLPNPGTRRVIERHLQVPRAPALPDADDILAPRAPSPEGDAFQAGSDDEGNEAPSQGNELQAPSGPETGPAA